MLISISRLFVCLAAFSSSCIATSLPAVHIKDVAGGSHLLRHDRPVWVQVGNYLIHPPERQSGLSTNIDHYYYAYGSPTALNEELRSRRVGGDGRVHIFHLPEGPDAVKTPSAYSSRRKSVSALIQLKHGQILSDAKVFPKYDLNPKYTSPLTPAASIIEKRVIDQLQESSIMSELSNLTALHGKTGPPTRSYLNAEATSATVSYLLREFQSMGLATCLQTSQRDGITLTNLVAHLAGDAALSSVILGGHYDSRPFEGLAPGAVDNGSGAAAVLSIARAITKQQVKPTHGIFFVAFAAEEPGLWGSEDFANRLQAASNDAKQSAFIERGESSSSKLFNQVCALPTETSFLQAQRNHARVAAAKHQALILDEVAWKSPNIEGGADVVNLESFDWASDVLEQLAQASKTHNGDTLSVTHSGHPFGSDHMSFLQKGYQSVLSIHGDDEGYPFYHSSEDTMANVNAVLYTKIVRMNAGALLRLSGIAA
jgi:hypothetical protein